MQKIMALVDGSAYSQSVCDHAAYLAKLTNAHVDVVSVIGRRNASSQPTNLSGNIGLGARSALLEELADLDAAQAKLSQQRARLILDDAKARLHKGGVEEVGIKLRNGDLVETVEELENDYDVIVIGKRGEGADFAKLHLGSNLERVARVSQKPVLVVSRAYKPIKRVLIAFDGGKSARKAVDHLASNPSYKDLECVLLGVGPLSREDTKLHQQKKETLEGAGLSVEAMIVDGHVEDVISEKIQKDNIDLLMMGAFGHSRLRNLFIGSTTAEMIRSCKIPVMLFR